MRPAALALLLLAGCAQTMYQWGGYDERLYRHYKNPQLRDEYVAAMRDVIAAAEQQGARVPPGCYAEYGWALFEQGNATEAVAYFEKEKAAWPESTLLMDKVIRVASRAR